MNQPSAARFEPDLRLSPVPAILALAVVGVAVGLAGGNAAHVVHTQPVALLLLAIALFSWLLGQWRSAAGAWFLVISLSLVIPCAGLWLDLPLAPLAVLPIALAAALNGPIPAFITAGLATLLLPAAARLAAPGAPAGDAGLLAATLVVVWSLTAILWGLDRRVREVALWSWDHYQLARASLDEVYEGRAHYEQALADLLHANRQLALMNDRLAAARLAAEEAQKAKAAFVANVSHEFRTPLNMIIGLTDLMLETPDVYGQALSPALLEDLEIVYRNCEHLASLINDVLDLSQIEAGQLALRREPVALAGVVERALNIVGPLIAKKGLALELAVDPALPDVYCDRTRIRQVILNLLSNAARVTERGGITVRIAGEERFAVVSVSDTGPGITPEDAGRLFQPFYRGTGNGVGGMGSGLGLSISRHFVELHGGRMWLQSAPGEGSTFYFRLPISPFEEPARKPEARNVEDWVWYERAAPSTLPREPLRPRVLVCDEAGDLAVFCARHWDQVEVVPCRDVNQAVAEARQSPAAMLLLNSVSPSLLYGQVEQARQAVNDTPIIGCAFPPVASLATEAGAAGYLPKPALHNDLQAALMGLGRPVRRVLIVDNNPDAQRLYTRMLQTCDQALEVEATSSGASALARLADWPADLVLLDIMLPDNAGWQLLAAKSQDPALRDVPVIIVSAEDPAEPPPASRVLVAAFGEGLSPGRLLRCAQALPALMTGLEPAPGPEPG